LINDLEMAPPFRLISPEWRQ